MTYNHSRYRVLFLIIYQRETAINKTDGITFQNVTRADFADILELEKKSFSVQDQLCMEDFEEFYSSFSDGFYKLLSDSLLIGYIIFFIENGSGYIESIAIDRRYRKNGYGICALRFIIRKFSDMKIHLVSLHVRTDNTAAMKLYEKEGFSKNGRVEHFYTDGSPAYIYTRELYEE